MTLSVSSRRKAFSFNQNTFKVRKGKVHLRLVSIGSLTIRIKLQRILSLCLQPSILQLQRFLHHLSPVMQWQPKVAPTELLRIATHLSCNNRHLRWWWIKTSPSSLKSIIAVVCPCTKLSSKIILCLLSTARASSPRQPVSSPTNPYRLTKQAWWLLPGALRMMMNQRWLPPPVSDKII